MFHDVDVPGDEADRLVAERLDALAPQLAALRLDRALPPRRVVFCRQTPQRVKRQQLLRRQAKIRLLDSPRLITESTSDTTTTFLFVLLLQEDGGGGAPRLADEAYVIYIEQWNKASFLPGEKCKTFHLDTLLEVRVASVSSPTTPISLDLETMPIPTLSVAPRLVLSDEIPVEELFRAEATPTALHRYAQLLIDVAMAPKFARQGVTIDTLVEEYATYRRARPDHSHAEAVIGFLYGVTRHIDRPQRAQNLFEHVAHVENQLRRVSDTDELVIWHFIYDDLSTLPVWLSQYTINEPGENGLVYWRASPDHARYVIHSDWLFKMVPASSATAWPPPLLHGRLELDATTFTQSFMPALQRELLCDLFQWLSQKRRDFLDDLLVTLFNNMIDSASEHTRVEFFDTIPLFDRFSLVNCHDFSVEYGAPTTRVAKLLLERLARSGDTMSISSSSSSSSFGSSGVRVMERDALPDIEDLATLLPPCLDAILGGKKRLREMDRLNATAYLAEMQYSREEIVAFLSDSSVDTSVGKEIGAKYDALQKRKTKNPLSYHTNSAGSDNATRYSTLSCNAVIVKNHAPHDLFRCPYQQEDARQRGQQQQQKYTDQEKAQFRARCCREKLSASTGAIWHPLDFVYARINKAT